MSTASLDELQYLRAAQREDLALFTAMQFGVLAPGDTFSNSWSVAAMCHQFEEVLAGRCPRLLLNAPPRSLKSIIVSVAGVAWALGRDPTRRFICLSHTQDFASELHNACRRLMKSPSYRAVFPYARISARKDTETTFTMTEGGGRTALSLTGPLTGRGGDCLIIDDPMKAGDSYSELRRQEVINQYRAVVASRLNNPATGAIVVVAQRLHEDDLPGYLLEQGGWKELRLQAQAENDAVIPVGPGMVHLYKKGDVLDPTRWSPEVLAQQARDMGEGAFGAQYQQRPQSLDGAIFKKAWIRYADPPQDYFKHGLIIQSWDIAVKTGDRHDFSVCTTWLRVRDVHYLLDLYRAKLEYPDLRRMVIDLRAKHGADIVLIEDTVSGQALLQELRHDRFAQGRVFGVSPTAEKQARAVAQSWKFEASKVFIACKQDWSTTLVQELLAFPRSRHDDQVDSVVQYLGFDFRPDTVNPDGAILIGG